MADDHGIVGGGRQGAEGLVGDGNIVEDGARFEGDLRDDGIRLVREQLCKRVLGLRCDSLCRSVNLCLPKSCKVNRKIMRRAYCTCVRHWRRLRTAWAWPWYQLSSVW
jgi:hypothetical protein